MRKIALVMLLVLVGSAASGCAPAGEATPTPTPEPAPFPVIVSPTVLAMLLVYDDPAGYFTISYPAKWEVSAAAQQVEFIEPHGNLHILVQYAEAGQVLDAAMMRDLVESYFASGELLGVTGYERVSDTVREDGSVLVEYSFTASGTRGYGSTLFRQQGTVLYLLSFWSGRQDLWMPSQALFETVSGTFVPTPPGPP